MSIELIQTMQWTKLCWENSWESIVDLDRILPQFGQVYPVKIQRNEDFAKEGKAFILWQPPHSELNGWHEKRPSEILKSYVLDGLIKNISPSGLEFDFHVNNRVRLIDFLVSLIYMTNHPCIILVNKMELLYFGQMPVSL